MPLADEEGETINVVKRQCARDDAIFEKHVAMRSFIDFADEAADVVLLEFTSTTTKLTDAICDNDGVTRNQNVQCVLKIRQMFRNQDLLKRTTSLYAIKENFNFKVIKSCLKQYYISCIDNDCGWFLKSSRVDDSSNFKIRSMEDTHTCPIDTRMSDQRQASSKIMSDCIKSKFFNLKTLYTPADIIRDMKDEYGVNLNYKRAWRARRVAVGEVRGKPDESYQKISCYLKMIIKANPESIGKLSISADNNFQLLFMAMYASIKGWPHCRPIVVVDGTILKASYGGKLITTSVQDAKAHILSLAFAIVDSENDLAYD